MGLARGMGGASGLRQAMERQRRATVWAMVMRMRGASSSGGVKGACYRLTGDRGRGFFQSAPSSLVKENEGARVGEAARAVARADP